MKRRFAWAILGILLPACHPPPPPPAPPPNSLVRSGDAVTIVRGHRSFTAQKAGEQQRRALTLWEVFYDNQFGTDGVGKFIDYAWWSRHAQQFPKSSPIQESPGHWDAKPMLEMPLMIGATPELQKQINDLRDAGRAPPGEPKTVRVTYTPMQVNHYTENGYKMFTNHVFWLVEKFEVF
jgi:hypothetical protein